MLDDILRRRRARGGEGLICVRIASDFVPTPVQIR